MTAQVCWCGSGSASGDQKTLHGSLAPAFSALGALSPTSLVLRCSSVRFGTVQRDAVGEVKWDDEVKVQGARRSQPLKWTLLRSLLCILAATERPLIGRDALYLECSLGETTASPLAPVGLGLQKNGACSSLLTLLTGTSL